MNKKLFLTLAAGIFTLLSCSDPKVEVGDSSVKSTSKVTVVVTNAIDGLPVTGAKVTLMSGKSAREQGGIPGTYVFDNVNVGSHNVLVEKTGYAKMIYRETVSSDGSENGIYVNVYVAQDVSRKVDLFPLTSSLEGFVYCTDKDNKVSPAKDATVKLIFKDASSGESFVDKIISADDVTGVDGKYTFGALPATYFEYDILVEEGTFCGIDYQASTLPDANVNLALGALVSNGQKTISNNANAEVFVVSDYTNIIKYNELGKAVTFTFTAPVDTSKMLANTIDLGAEYADIKWSNGYKTLTLTPAKWDANFDVCFTDLKSTANKDLTGGTSDILTPTTMCYPVFITTIELKNAVTDLTFKNIGTCGGGGGGAGDVNEGFGGGCFSWKGIEGATGYELLCKIDNEKKPSNNKNYAVCGTADANETQAQASFGGGVTIGGDTVRVWVRAFNDQYITPFDEGKIVKLWDKKAPELSFVAPKGDYVATINLTDYLINSGNANTYAYCWPTAFPESMDPAAITVSPLSATVSRLSNPTHRWLNDNKNLCFDFTINLGDKITSAINVAFSINGLKDAIGNEFKGNYSDGTENKITFRVVATP